MIPIRHKLKYLHKNLVSWIYYKFSNTPVIINEYPRSGGTWIKNFLKNYTGKGFVEENFLPDNILHGHRISMPKARKIICVWRDPRDLYISYYFYLLVSNDKNKLFVDDFRKIFNFENYEDVSVNLEFFLDAVHSNKIYPYFSYIDYLDFWHKAANVHHIFYEDIEKNPHLEFKKLLHYLKIPIDKLKLNNAIDKCSFFSVTGRKPGEENINSFYRFGKSKNWPNILNENCKKFFQKKYNQKLLRRYFK